MLAIREEGGPVVADLALRKHGGGSRYAARHGHSLERGPIPRIKDNHAFSTPRAATIVWGVGECNGRPARNVDFLELSACEESKRGAVGRPEWRRGALGPGERLRCKRVE